MHINLCDCHSEFIVLTATVFNNLQAKLTDLYHRASDDAESRVKELVGAVEKLQTLIEEVSQEKDQLQLQIDEEISRCVCVCFTPQVVNNGIIIHFLYCSPGMNHRNKNVCLKSHS